MSDATTGVTRGKASVNTIPNDSPPSASCHAGGRPRPARGVLVRIIHARARTPARSSSNGTMSALPGPTSATSLT
jgi:hypothetical protein